MSVTLRSISGHKRVTQLRKRLLRYFHSRSLLYASKASKYKFPSRPNPSPWEIFHLPRDASQNDIKTRYFELVRLYHPDTCKSQGIDPALAESRFQAVTNAYNSLRLGTGSGNGSSESTERSEADEIREKFAAWRAKERSTSNAYDWQRRQRAMYAEANATKWWKTDGMLIWLFAGITVAVGIMHFTTRSPERRAEDARRYLRMRNQHVQEQERHFTERKTGSKDES